MAQFRAIIQGARGEVSRLGHKPSGIDATINGWTSGIHVDAGYDAKTKQDVFDIWSTGGSRGIKVGALLGTLRSSMSDEAPSWEPKAPSTTEAKLRAVCELVAKLPEINFSRCATGQAIRAAVAVLKDNQ